MISTAPSTKRVQAPAAFVLDLMPGKIVDLQISSPTVVRLKLALVGYDLGKYLILKYPSGNLTEYSDVLTVGNVAIIRYIVEGKKGECIAFASTIRAVSAIGDKLIFLDYPKRIENRQLRSSQRSSTHIPAKIEMLTSDDSKTGASLTGVIIDISTKGCQFAFKTDKRDMQVKKSAIAVSIRSTISDQPIELTAIVRNSHYDHGHINVGIQFSEKETAKIENLLSALAIDIP